ncbi:cyclic nucleotide-binding domain-containing protein [Anditalea andensis]|uniref:Cyclic nucleotide-binding domain-containing protein n=1 Tax=Anditalea andensis TaxID=1048983 RepID=A0A074KNX0_9BACT|nr:Crp/Fnr family transcriptional regulator [Anditalea andensis]KEO71611.1 hypothetical protein EL17_23990 [Anditalea andensis]
MEEEFLKLIRQFSAHVISLFPKQSIKLDDIDWGSLTTYLTDHRYPAGSVLKKPETVEKKSRLVLEGLVVAYRERGDSVWKPYRVYEAGDVAVDLSSMKERKPSGLKFVAYTQVRVVELAYADEIRLLKSHPELNALSAHINNYLFIREASFSSVLSLPNKERYDAFLTTYKQAASMLKIRDVGDLLQFSWTTFKRVRKRKE